MRNWIPTACDLATVRISSNYRAVGVRDGQTITWFFIGTHAEYDALIRRM